jgi:hypothetical protein
MAKNACHQCGRKFGLVRHNFLKYAFCSRVCIEGFKKRLAADMLRRKNYRWFTRAQSIVDEAD